MKKLGLTFAAIGLFFATTAQAQVYSEASTEAEMTTQQVQDDYVQLEAAELPAAVSTAVTRDYAGATTQEVWMKEKDGKTVYKLKVDVDGTEETLYADAEGNWIEKDEKKKDK